MNFSSSLKKIICLLLAALMLLSTVGCKQETSKKKKKVVVKKKVIVNNNDEENNQSNIQVVVPDNNNSATDTEKEDEGLPERPLPEVAEEEDGGYVEWEEPIVPEFEYEYADLSITEDYVIVYAFEKWENRKESATKVGTNADGTPILEDRYINNTGIARLSAYDLQEWLKTEYNLKLEVVKDTVVDENAKKILVGDTAFYKTNLDEQEFGVKVVGDDLVFEAGHVALITKSVKWFETVETKSGKVATLSGKTEDFKSQVTINGITYDWVWGDEFDGSELINKDNWKQTEFGTERGDDYRGDMFNDPYFHYVENGRLRMTADIYYNETDLTKKYAASGDTQTDGYMQYRNGYVEVRARLPYRRGGFPAIWTMSNTDNKYLPNYNFDDGYGQISKAFWTIEFDLFESFGDADHMSTTVHKWYNISGLGKDSLTVSGNKEVYEIFTNEQLKELNERAYKEGGDYRWVTDSIKINYNLTDEFVEEACYKVGERYVIDNGLLDADLIREVEKKDINGETITDEAGNPVTETKFIYYPIILKRDEEDGGAIDIYEYRRRPLTNMSQLGNTYAYSFTYDSTANRYLGEVKDGTYNWQYYFDPDTINQEYHVYSFLLTSDHCSVMLDGERFLDFDWDPAYDYFDKNGDGKIEDISLNNNGVGYNLWHYFLFDMMIYTPGNYTIDEARKLQKGDYPFNLYIDWIRVYQDLDDPSQAIWYPNGEAD